MSPDYQNERWDVEVALTPRQYEVLLLIANGSTLKQVALELYITLETVKTHLKNIKRKLEAKTTAHACFLLGEDRYIVRHHGQLPKHGFH